MKNTENLERLLKMVEQLAEENSFRLLGINEELNDDEMFSYDLVGIINMGYINKPRVLIIKNGMNDISGLVPLSIWISLIEDKILLNKEDTQEETKEEIKEETKEDINLNKIFDDLSNIFTETFSKTFTKTFSETKTTDFINETRSVIKNVIDKENISIKLELKELKMIREKAIKNKVQTKGFIKKINERILLVESYLSV